MDGLSAYDAILLSDVGANSLLLHPDVWLHGKTYPNRLKLLRDWTGAGGGLVMIGGYFSFQGIDGKARWGRTAVQEALPVPCLPYDDRLEIPEGFKAVVEGPAEHPILPRLGTDWPVLLGANEVVLKTGPDVEVLASLQADQGGHPLLVTGRFGNGRTAVWTSDIGPHWLPQTFVDWPGYGILWEEASGLGHGEAVGPARADRRRDGAVPDGPGPVQALRRLFTSDRISPHRPRPCGRSA